MAENTIRQRAQKNFLRVSFPDGTVICYSSATLTFIEALRKIGVDKLQDIDLEIGHLPIFSKECYPKYAKYMKPLDDGWYVNTQSDSSQKYIQLTSIKNTLNLDINVEIGTDMQPCSTKGFTKSRKGKDCLLVKFPDGEFVGGENPRDTYIAVLEKLGLESIRQKGIEAMGKECVTSFNKYPKQIKTDKGLWITLPNTTKDKVRALNYISSRFRIELEISIL